MVRGPTGFSQSPPPGNGPRYLFDLHGLPAGINFATTHCTKFDRIALVGDKPCERWIAMVCKPFTMAKVQYFDAADIDRAWAWLQQD